MFMTSENNAFFSLLKIIPLQSILPGSFIPCFCMGGPRKCGLIGKKIYGYHYFWCAFLPGVLNGGNFFIKGGKFASQNPQNLDNTKSESSCKPWTLSDYEAGSLTVTKVPSGGGC